MYRVNTMVFVVIAGKNEAILPFIRLNKQVNIKYLEKVVLTRVNGVAARSVIALDHANHIAEPSHGPLIITATTSSQALGYITLQTSTHLNLMCGAYLSKRTTKLFVTLKINSNKDYCSIHQIK